MSSPMRYGVPIGFWYSSSWLVGLCTMLKMRPPYFGSSVTRRKPFSSTTVSYVVLVTCVPGVAGPFHTPVLLVWMGKCENLNVEAVRVTLSATPPAPPRPPTPPPAPPTPPRPPTPTTPPVPPALVPPRPPPPPAATPPVPVPPAPP